MRISRRDYFEVHLWYNIFLKRLIALRSSPKKLHISVENFCRNIFNNLCLFHIAKGSNCQNDFDTTISSLVKDTDDTPRTGTHEALSDFSYFGLQEKGL